MHPQYRPNEKFRTPFTSNGCAPNVRRKFSRIRKMREQRIKSIQASNCIREPTHLNTSIAQKAPGSRPMPVTYNFDQKLSIIPIAGSVTE
ncbi:hypothetical protein GCM10027093_74400 [Paraburkholderia jirisanensis]